jgi:hypothetical protein
MFDWQVANMMLALRRSGFREADMMKQADDSLLLTYEGRMNVVSGYNKHINVKQEELNSTEVVTEYSVPLLWRSLE